MNQGGLELAKHFTRSYVNAIAKGVRRVEGGNLLLTILLQQVAGLSRAVK